MSVTGSKIVAVCGPIGAGKTTLVKSLEQSFDRLNTEIINGNDDEAKRFGTYSVKTYDEAVHPALLNLFLCDQRKYAFSFQLFMLTRRQLNYELARTDHVDISIIDRSLTDDLVFASLQHKLGNISGDEFAAYKEIYDSFKPNKPDIVLWLKVPVDVAMQRIAKRNRDNECNYTREYISLLHKTYDEVLTEQFPPDCGVKVIPLVWDEDVPIIDNVLTNSACDDLIGEIIGKK